MLCLSRKRNEDIIIDVGSVQIVIRVIEIRSDKVRLGIEAPRGVPIHRREVWEDIHKEKTSRDLPKL